MGKLQDRELRYDRGREGQLQPAAAVCGLSLIHISSAPDHEPYQGRQYSDKEYKRLNSRLQRRIGTLSCKHIAWPIKLGVDSPQWPEEQLAEMARENAKGVTYEGRHYTCLLYTSEQG